MRQYAIESIPHNLKLAVSASVGLFLAVIALEEAKVVVPHPATLVTLSDLKIAVAYLMMLFGFVLIVVPNYQSAARRALDWHPDRDRARHSVRPD